MLENKLTSKYKQYKADTNFVASWLANTAKRCGYPEDQLTPPARKSVNCQENQKSQRLKGKARKLAREASSKLESEASSTPQPGNLTYTLAIEDFVALAEFIASYKTSPVQVPASFVTAIERAIKLRKDRASTYTGHDDADNKHNYFIGVLERVRDTLSPLMRDDSSLKDVHRRPSAKEDDLSNRFSVLDVHEHSEGFQQAPESATSESAKADVAYETELPGYEATVAWSLLLEDIDEFRAALINTWTMYGEGLIDLVTASIVTSAAFDLVKHLEEDIEPVVAKYGGTKKCMRGPFDRIWETWAEIRDREDLPRDHEDLLWDQGEIPEDQGEIPGDPMNSNMSELSGRSWIFPTYLILTLLSKRLQPSSEGRVCLPFYRVPEYDPTSTRSTKTTGEKFQEDLQIFQQTACEMLTWAARVRASPTDAQLTRELRVMFETSEISVTLLFSTQVFLDIHHLLREKASRAFSDVERYLLCIRKTTESMLGFHKHPAARAASNSKLLQEVRRQTIWLQIDPLRVRLRNNCYEEEPHKLFKLHPLFCGLLMYRIRVVFQEASLELAYALRSLMESCHLYNALCEEGLLQKRWADMDLLLSLHGDSAFAGGRPNANDNYRKRLYLSRGFPMDYFTADATARDENWHNQTLRSKRAERCLTPLAPVSRVFSNRLWTSSPRNGFTRHDIDKILAQMARRTETRNRGTGGTALQPYELLGDLREAIFSESLGFCFDYLMLHRICWNLFRTIADRCQDEMREIFGEEFGRFEPALPQVVEVVLGALVDADEKGGWTPDEVTMLSNVKKQAVKAVEELIDDGSGDVVTRFLKDHVISGFECQGDQEYRYLK